MAAGLDVDGSTPIVPMSAEPADEEGGRAAMSMQFRRAARDAVDTSAAQTRTPTAAVDTSRGGRRQVYQVNIRRSGLKFSPGGRA